MKDLFNHQNSMVFGVKKIQRRHCRAFLKDQIPNHILLNIWLFLYNTIQYNLFGLNPFQLHITFNVSSPITCFPTIKQSHNESRLHDILKYKVKVSYHIHCWKDKLLMNKEFKTEIVMFQCILWILIMTKFGLLQVTSWHQVTSSSIPSTSANQNLCILESNQPQAPGQTMGWDKLFYSYLWAIKTHFLNFLFSAAE